MTFVAVILTGKTETSHTEENSKSTPHKHASASTGYVRMVQGKKMHTNIEVSEWKIAC